MARVLRIDEEQLNNDYDGYAWQELIAEYFSYKRATGIKASTIKNMEDNFKVFFKKYPKAIEQGFKTAVFEFLSEDIKAATYNARLSYLRNLIDWCVEEGIARNNPLKSFKRKRTQPRTVQVETEDILKLINIFDKRTFAGLRDYGLIVLTLDSGLRPNEALSLRLDDINFKSQEVYVREEFSKTKVARTLPVSEVCLKAIKKIVINHHPSWESNNTVFCTCEGKKMKSNSWTHRMSVYSKKLSCRIRPYDLRHFFAVQYLRNGGNAISLQKIMGHSDMEMTKWYIQLSSNDLIEQHNIASPLKNILGNEKRKYKL